MAFCQKCGSQIGDQQKFCPKCGEKQIIEDTPVSAPAQVASSKSVVEKPAQPYRKGFMTASNILSVIALAIFLYSTLSGTFSLLFTEHKDVLNLLITILVIIGLLSILSFIFGIFSKHKTTLFLSIFTLTVGMYPLLIRLLQEWIINKNFY